MNAFWRRLRPDHLAGQIALLVLATIIIFHLTSTTFHYLGVFEGLPPPIEPVETIAGGFVALDAAPPAERDDVAALLAKTSPWIKWTVIPEAPAAVDDAEGAADAQAVQARLWPGARVSPVSGADGHPRLKSVAVGLRKGGFAIAEPLQQRATMEASALHPPLFTRLLERSAQFFFLCVTILTVWASNAVVAPLVRLAREAERYPDERGDPQPLAECGPQEVKEVSRALNRMQSRIQTMIAARSHALAAISHDLRTIITRIRLRTEFMSDETLKEKMLHDVELMDSMLYKNLQHLRDAAESPERSLIDLDSVLQTVADQFVDLGHDVTYRGGDRQVILGSLTAMQRVFNNLVENAVAHAKSVVISLEQSAPGCIRVDVSDDGPGIPPQQRARMLEPFERGEPARTMNGQGGFGLGLSIVRALVEEIGGSLQLLGREPTGLVARVTLPRAFVKDCSAPADQKAGARS